MSLSQKMYQFDERTWASIPAYLLQSQDANSKESEQLEKKDTQVYG